MKRILGIDPALTRTGWGVIEVTEPNNVSFVSTGVITTDSKMEINLRLKSLAAELDKVARSYSLDEVAIEETFVNKNPLSSLKLGHARGAIIITLANLDLPIFEYSATEIKKNVTGMGRADKEQVERMVKLLLPKAVIKYSDEADALATALCHVQFRQFNKFIA
jgi:crossover junction endodeoxyribonuclease RuvC